MSKASTSNLYLDANANILTGPSGVRARPNDLVQPHREGPRSLNRKLHRQQIREGKRPERGQQDVDARASGDGSTASAPIVVRSSNRRHPKITVPSYSVSKVTAVMKRIAPTMVVEGSDFMINDHALSNARRQVEQYQLVAQIGGVDTPFIDFGGRLSQYARIEAPAVHVCHPLLSAQDFPRWEEDLEKLKRRVSCVAEETKSLLLQRLMTEGEGFCTHKSQECTYQAEAGIFLHSLYDYSPSDVAATFKSHGLRQAVGTVMFSPKILIEDEGELPGHDAQYRIHRSPGSRPTISFSFKGAASHTYRHDLANYVRLFTTSIAVFEDVCIMIEKSVVEDTVFFKFARTSLHFDVPQALEFNLWLNRGSDDVVVNVFEAGSVYTPVSKNDVKTRRVVTPKSFYEKLKTHLLAVTADKMKFLEAYNLARGVNTRFSVNGVDIATTQGMPADDLYAVTRTIFCEVLTLRASNEALLEQFSDNRENLAAIANMSCMELVKLMFHMNLSAFYETELTKDRSILSSLGAVLRKHTASTYAESTGMFRKTVANQSVMNFTEVLQGYASLPVNYTDEIAELRDIVDAACLSNMIEDVKESIKSVRSLARTQKGTEAGEAALRSLNVLERKMLTLDPGYQGGPVDQEDAQEKEMDKILPISRVDRGLYEKFEEEEEFEDAVEEFEAGVERAERFEEPPAENGCLFDAVAEAAGEEPAVVYRNFAARTDPVEELWSQVDEPERTAFTAAEIAEANDLTLEIDTESGPVTFGNGPRKLGIRHRANHFWHAKTRSLSSLWWVWLLLFLLAISAGVGIGAWMVRPAAGMTTPAPVGIVVPELQPRNLESVANVTRVEFDETLQNSTFGIADVFGRVTSDLGRVASFLLTIPYEVRFAAFFRPGVLMYGAAFAFWSLLLVGRFKLALFSQFLYATIGGIYCVLPHYKMLVPRSKLYSDYVAGFVPPILLAPLCTVMPSLCKEAPTPLEIVQMIIRIVCLYLGVGFEFIAIFTTELLASLGISVSGIFWWFVQYAVLFGMLFLLVKYSTPMSEEEFHRSAYILGVAVSSQRPSHDSSGKVIAKTGTGSIQKPLLSVSRVHALVALSRRRDLTVASVMRIRARAKTFLRDYAMDLESERRLTILVNFKKARTFVEAQQNREATRERVEELPDVPVTTFGELAAREIPDLSEVEKVISVGVLQIPEEERMMRRICLRDNALAYKKQEYIASVATHHSLFNCLNSSPAEKRETLNTLRMREDELMLYRREANGLYSPVRGQVPETFISIYSRTANSVLEELEGKGDFLRVSIVKGTNQIRVASTDEYLLASGNSVENLTKWVYLNLREYNFTSLVNLKPVRFVMRTGPAGCGKTTTIAREVELDDGVVVTSKSGKDELAKKLGEKAEMVEPKTVASAMVNGMTQCKRLFIDEGFMLHQGDIEIMAEMSGADEVQVFGDPKQLAFINRVTGFSEVPEPLNADQLREYYSNYDVMSNFLENDMAAMIFPYDYEVHTDLTYRNKKDIAVIFRDLHGAAYKSASTAANGVSVDKTIPIGSIDDVPRESETLYLTFTKKDKRTMMNAGFVDGKKKWAIGARPVNAPGVLTIGECQGTDFEHVKLVRLSKHIHAGLLNDLAQTYVAMTRHKQSFGYFKLIDSTDDEIEKRVNMAVNIAGNVDILHDTGVIVGGKRNSRQSRDRKERKESIMHQTLAKAKALFAGAMLYFSNSPEVASLEAVDFVSPTEAPTMLESGSVSVPRIECPAPIIQAFYDEILPGNSFTDTRYNNSIVNYSDTAVLVNAEFKVYSTEKLYARPKPRNTYEPLIRTSAAPIRDANFKRTLHGLNKRNFAVASLTEIVDISARRAKLVERFFKTYWGDDYLDKLNACNAAPVYVTEEALTKFFEAQRPDVKEQLLINGFNTTRADMKLDEFEVILKQLPKPADDTTAQKKESQPQTVMFQGKLINMVYGSVFRQIFERFIFYCRPNVLIQKGKSYDDVVRFLKEREFTGEVDFIENDFSDYDKSQDWRVYDLEVTIFTMLGLDADLAQDWYAAHMRTTNLVRAVHMRIFIAYQRKSGDVTTSLGNTVAGAVALVLGYDFLRLGIFIFIILLGDDSLVAMPRGSYSDKDVRFGPAKITNFFGFACKVQIYSVGYCVGFYIGIINGNFEIISDILRRVDKLGRWDIKDEKLFHEIWISLKDSCRGFDDELKVDMLARGVGLRYPRVSAGSVKLAAYALNSVTKSYREFRRLYSEEKTYSEF